MTFLQHDILCHLFIFITIFISIGADIQDFLNLQHKAAHLPETRFSFSEYSEYPDGDGDAGPQVPQWDQLSSINYNLRLKNFNRITTERPSQSLNTLDPNITWDSQWASNLKLGQISAVSIDLDGNIVIFHRGSRVWGEGTFNKNRFNPNNGPITENTIVLLDKTGKILLQWGRNMFYMPHGLTIDSFGNYWITDVALHQVFKFDAQDIATHWEDLKREQFSTETTANIVHDTNALFKNSILKPSLVLGESFEPGNDEKRFCKPTAVAVQPDGDFFISDGYCNSRIIKYNKNGERILQWGRHWGTGEPIFLQEPPPNAFFVPHALALANDLRYIFVADRENGRILSFSANNGTFYKEYKHPTIGTKIYSIAYNRQKIYLVNGPDIFEDNREVPVRGFIIDVSSGNILSQFAPEGNMQRPHDLAVTEDGSEIYVVELDSHKIYRFLQEVNDANKLGNSAIQSSLHHQTAPLTDVNSKDDAPTTKTTMATLILSLITAAVIFIALCVAIAAIVARCQKRGCLLTMRKRMRWEAERKENFKLSSLLETRRSKRFKFLDKRPNKRDFSKVNTEPETSDDDHPENSLAKMI